MINFKKNCDYSIVLSTDEEGTKFVSIMQMSELNEFGIPSLLLDEDNTFGVELLNESGTYDECHSIMTDLILSAQKVLPVQVLENPDPQGEKRFQVYVGSSIPEDEIQCAFDISDDNPDNLVGEKVDKDKYRTTSL